MSEPASEEGREVPAGNVVAGLVLVLYGLLLGIGMLVSGSVGAVAPVWLWLLTVASVTVGVGLIAGVALASRVVVVVIVGMIALGGVAAASQRSGADIALVVVLLVAPALVAIGVWSARGLKRG